MGVLTANYVEVPLSESGEVMRGRERIQNTDWREKLSDPWNKPSSVGTMVDMLVIAESVGQIGEPDIIAGLRSSFASEARIYAGECKKYETLLEKDAGNLEAKMMLPNYAKQKRSFELELDRLNDDAYALEWYEKAKAAIVTAKQEVIAHAQVVNDQLRDFFEGIRREPWQDIHTRVIPVTVEEFRSFIEAENGTGEHTISMVHGRRGYATKIRSGESRVAIVKLETHSKLKNADNPDEGVELEVLTTAAKSNAGHEALHLMTDGSRPVQEILGVKHIDRRGFRWFYMQDTGEINVNETPFDEPPQIAMDEGAVTFLQAYFENGQDIMKVKDIFDKKILFGMSAGYHEAARATADVVLYTGINRLAYAYANSDIDGWVQSVEELAGSSRLRKYAQDIATAQKRIQKESLSCV